MLLKPLRTRQRVYTGDVSMASLLPSRFCTIFSVAHKHQCRWKWRSCVDDGPVDECAEEYDAFLECTAAARALGLVPRSDWIGPLSLCLRAK